MMTDMIPSIFNDVIGPVMRGPSSSHSAAGVRIGRMARDLMNGRMAEVIVRVDKGGALATTHRSQGSDMGICGGLLGWDTDDARLPTAVEAVHRAGMDVRFEITDLHEAHPSTYCLRLKNESEAHSMTAVSIGGGLIEILNIDGVDLSMDGGFHEILIIGCRDPDGIIRLVEQAIRPDAIVVLNQDHEAWIQVKCAEAPDTRFLKSLREHFGTSRVKTCSPVLPILSRKAIEVPFLSATELEAFNEKRNLDLAELASVFECARGNLAEGIPFQMMQRIVEVLRDSTAAGLAGTHHEDRILGFQSGRFQALHDEGKLLDAGIFNRMILNVTALMEVKSAMGLIAAAPTAGSCGCLPGALFSAHEALGLSEEVLTRAFLAAGLIGVFIAAHTPLTAEVSGCQSECGASSGMTAAALVYLAGGSVKQSINAASLALQNTLGMICDPVAKRVEVPCLGRNVMAAGNALASANMALAGFDPVIPLDEVIGVIKWVDGTVLDSIYRVNE